MSAALQLVFKQEASDVLMTDSRRLAEGFGQRHADTLRKIEETLKYTDLSFAQQNFALVDIVEKNAIGGEVRTKYYQMTRDGFMMIALAFTGKKGCEFRVKVIRAFNEMEDRLGSVSVTQDLSRVSPNLLRQIADTLDAKDAVIESQVEQMTQSPLDLAEEHAKPLSAFVVEFPELRKKATDLYHEAVVTRKAGNMTPTGLLTMWIRKEFNFFTLKRGKVGDRIRTVTMYNRADILQVVERLRGDV